MSEMRQLELDLEIACEAAATSPATANLMQLWRTFEPVIARLPLLEQLYFGAELIDQLATLHQARADWFLEDWERPPDLEGPIFVDELLQGLVRQSQHIDVSELTSPPHRQTWPSKPNITNPDSVVNEVDKAQALEMVEQMTAEAEQAAVVGIAHDESVTDWVDRVNQWSHQQQKTEVSLLDLQKGVQMPLVKLWLALLLGGYGLEQRGNFYEAAKIWVSIPPQPAS